MGRKKKLVGEKSNSVEKASSAQETSPSQENPPSVDATVFVTKLSIGEGKVKRRIQKMIEMRDNDGIGNL